MPSRTCKHCGVKLVVKKTKETPSRKNKEYYYSSYYSCPNCKRLYHDDKFKVLNNEEQSLFAPNKTHAGGNVVNIWTDGACIFNGQKNAKAAWAFVSGDYEKAGKVIGKQTNNTAEAYAIYHALLWAAKNKHKDIRIHSDSQITLHNLTKSVERIKENREIFIKIYDLINKYGLSIEYVKVLGHSGDIQNERVDKLANSLASK